MQPTVVLGIVLSNAANYLLLGFEVGNPARKLAAKVGMSVGRCAVFGETEPDPGGFVRRLEARIFEVAEHCPA